MVSSCELYLDDIDLTGQKAFVPDFLSALFQESDRIEYRDEKNKVDIVEYRITRESILMRLDLMGCTEALSKKRFLSWQDEEIKDEEAYREKMSDDKDTISDDKTLNALRALTWEEWQRRVPDVLLTWYDLEKHDKYLDEIDLYMKNDDPSWLWFDGYDSLLSLRAIISASSDTKFIKLNIEPLIGGGWISAEEKVCDNKIRIVSSRGQPSGPTIILAEGQSDIKILKSSIVRFHPELMEFVTFLDHSEFRVDGGASYIVKFLKAFAAAQVPANIVAVFDNDTAGLSAYKEAIALNLPHNMTCVHLPDIELGNSYPTIGPQGDHDANINGKACGIELYLGRAALSSNGSLRPVRWTGYDKRAKVYQGEVDEKNVVQDVFLKAMRDGPGDLNEEYSEMKLLWNTIILAAVHVAEASQKTARAPRSW